MGAAQDDDKALREYQLRTPILAATHAVVWRGIARQLMANDRLNWSVIELAQRSGLPVKDVRNGLRLDRGGFHSVEQQRAIAQAFADAGALGELWERVDGGWVRLWPVAVEELPD